MKKFIYVVMKTLRHKTDQPLFRDDYSIAISYEQIVNT